jgi:hypothetical protein
VIDGEALRRSTPSSDRKFDSDVVATSLRLTPWIPRTGVSDPYSGPTTARETLPKGLAAVFTKGNTRYLVVSLTALAGLLASLGGSWFDGS